MLMFSGGVCFGGILASECGLFFSTDQTTDQTPILKPRLDRSTKAIARFGAIRLGVGHFWATCSHEYMQMYTHVIYLVLFID